MKLLLALPPIALLVACAAGSEAVWLRPGTPALAAERDYLQCAAEAQDAFPVTTRIATAPRITLSGGYCRDRICTGVSNIPDIYDYDQNEPLRERAIDVCMRTKGYDRTVLPACDGGETVLQSQPFDTRGVCVTRSGRIAAN
ncbi:hypothetical protein [Jannaschia seosinensis]|nr:hypothetical protein [Jannaschia seosinensis]